MTLRRIRIQYVQAIVLIALLTLAMIAAVSLASPLLELPMVRLVRVGIACDRHCSRRGAAGVAERRE